MEKGTPRDHILSTARHVVDVGRPTTQGHVQVNAQAANNQGVANPSKTSGRMSSTAQYSKNNATEALTW